VAETVFIGIGGNIGHPEQTIIRAFGELKAFAVGKIFTSRIWRSEAFGLEDKGHDFANAVARFQCELEPGVLLQRLQMLEVKFGRPLDHAHHRSRTLDLDIIAFGQKILLDTFLQVPHQHAWERLFVLLPLQETDPEFRFADRAETLQQLIDSAPSIKISLWHQDR